MVFSGKTYLRTARTYLTRTARRIYHTGRVRRVPRVPRPQNNYRRNRRGREILRCFILTLATLVNRWGGTHPRVMREISAEQGITRRDIGPQV